MDQGFFDVGQLYRRPGNSARGDTELFLVVHVSRPPGGFAAAGNRQPVAFGWRGPTSAGPSDTPPGPYATDARDDWEEVADSELVHVLGLTDTGSDDWRGATVPPAGAVMDDRAGGRRSTDPPADSRARPRAPSCRPSIQTHSAAPPRAP